MSVQGQKLTAIADAIRVKEGSTAPIPAADFPMRILALETGGGSGFAVPLVVSVDAGAQVTASLGDTSVSGVSDEGGSVTLTLTAPGEWTVTASLNGKEKSLTITVGSGYEATIRMGSNLPEGVTLPEGYVELEYIENPNLGYIRSWLYTPAGSYFEAKIDFPEYPASGGFMGGYGSNLKTKYYWGNSISLNAQSETDITVSTYYKASSQSSAGGRAQATLTQKNGPIILKQESANVSLDDVTMNAGTGAGTPVNQCFLGLGIWSMSSAGSQSNTYGSTPLNIRLYYLYMGKNNADKFIPCQDPDGNVGLYRLNTGVFYKSSVTNKPFAAGPAM